MHLERSLRLGKGLEELEIQKRIENILTATLFLVGPNTQMSPRDLKRLAVTSVKNCKGIVDFAVPADHRVKLKECKKRHKYLDFARELKKPWNINVTITPIVIGALSTVTKGLVKMTWK